MFAPRLHIIALLVLVALERGKHHLVRGDFDGYGRCHSVSCEYGYHCDPEAEVPVCVPVTCDAPDACPSDKMCVRRNLNCDRYPCPQFVCIASCRPNDCAKGYSCDVELDECVPITCEAQDACKTDEECHSASIVCEREPCPHFECLPKSCRTTCGKMIPSNSFYQDDGENACNMCLCMDGVSTCFSWLCPDDSTISSCDYDDKSTCTTTCGLQVESGTFFNDDGANYCNICHCGATGLVTCTRSLCDLKAPKATCNCIDCKENGPQCSDSCTNCRITPRTCDSCSSAVCLDEVIEAQQHNSLRYPGLDRF